MQTIELTRDEMAARVARFRDLAPLPTQTAAPVPLEAKDVIYARKLLSVIGLEAGATSRESSGLTCSASGRAGSKAPSISDALALR